MKSGSVLKGEVLTWDGEILEIKGDFGTLELKKALLAQSTLDMLASQSDDSSVLRAKITELEKTVESLLRDNQALRAQLQQSAASAPATSARQTALPSTPGAATPTAPSSSGGFWISSTGKRHNPSCRYFKTSNGSLGSAGQGTACKICGG